MKRHESSKVKSPRKETERQLASKTEGGRWGCFPGMGAAPMGGRQGTCDELQVGRRNRGWYAELCGENAKKGGTADVGSD